MLRMSWQQRRHHGFACIVISSGEQRGTTHRWMKTTSEGYTLSVKANTTHTQKTKGEIRKQKNMNLLLYDLINTWCLTRGNPPWIQWTCDGPWRWLAHQLPASDIIDQKKWKCFPWLWCETDILFPGHLREQHGHIVAEPASGTFL